MRATEATSVRAWPTRTDRAVPALMLAAVAGVVHASFTLYWALGGTFLNETLGARVLEQFGDRPLLLLPVAILKLAGAALPVLLHRRGWPGRRLTRTGAWLAALLLIVWGGANTIVGNLVLAGVIRPDGGYDHPAMVGHAWLWDPLFLLWGSALVVGLWWSRLGRSRKRAADLGHVANGP